MCQPKMTQSENPLLSAYAQAHYPENEHERWRRTFGEREKHLAAYAQAQSDHERARIANNLNNRDIMNRIELMEARILAAIRELGLNPK